MQELNDIHRIFSDSGMKLVSKEMFEMAFAKQQKLISVKNRASNLLLLASMILFSFSSALSFFTVVYVRGILPKENNEVKDNPVAAISTPILKIEENTDVKILQQEVAPVEVVKPAIKDKSRKKKAVQKAEPVTVVEEKVGPVTVVEEKVGPVTVVEEKVGPVIDMHGTKYWYLNGKFHREGGPAIEYSNGGKVWYLNGKRHRVGGPAIERATGDKLWYLNGELHRERGPAVELSSGGKEWWLNGVRQK